MEILPSLRPDAIFSMLADGVESGVAHAVHAHSDIHAGIVERRYSTWLVYGSIAALRQYRAVLRALGNVAVSRAREAI